MPNREEVQKKELAKEIARLSGELTYQETLKVLLASHLHEDTLNRYKTEVKKIPTARLLVSTMGNVLAERNAIPA